MPQLDVDQPLAEVLSGVVMLKLRDQFFKMLSLDQKDKDVEIPSFFLITQSGPRCSTEALKQGFSTGRRPRDGL